MPGVAWLLSGLGSPSPSLPVASFSCCGRKVFSMGVQQVTPGLGPLQEKAKMIKEA